MKFYKAQTVWSFNNLYGKTQTISPRLNSKQIMIPRVQLILKENKNFPVSLSEGKTFCALKYTFNNFPINFLIQKYAINITISPFENCECIL